MYSVEVVNKISSRILLSYARVRRSLPSSSPRHSLVAERLRSSSASSPLLRGPLPCCRKLKFASLPRGQRASPASSLETTDKPASELERLMKDGLLYYKDVRLHLERSGPRKDLDSRGLLYLRCLRKVPDITPEERIVLAEKLVESMRQQNVDVTEAHHVALLECYLESNYYQKLVSFVSSLKASKKELSDMMQLLLLKTSSEAGKINEVSSLFPDLENKGLNTESLYASMVYASGVSGDVDKACNLLKEMGEKEIVVGSQVYTSVLRVAVAKGNEEMFRKYTEEAQGKNVKLSDDQFTSILETAGKQNCHLMPLVLRLWGKNFPLHLVQNVLVKMIYSDHINCAVASFVNLLEATEFDWTGFHKALIKALITVKYPLGNVVETCRTLSRYEPCKHSLELVLHWFLKQKDAVRALSIMKAMRESGSRIEPHYFWPIMINAHERFGSEGMFQVLEKMEEYDVLSEDVTTYSDVVLPRLNANRMNEELRRIHQISRHKFGLVQELFVMHALDRGLFAECLEFLEEFPLSSNVDYGFMRDHCENALTKFPVTEEAIRVVKMTDSVEPLQVISKLFNAGNTKDAEVLMKLFCKHEMPIKDMKKTKQILRNLSPSRNIRNSCETLIKMNEERTEKIKGNATRSLKPSALELYQDIEDHKVNLSELTAKGMDTIAQRLRLIHLYAKANLAREAIAAREDFRRLTNDQVELTRGNEYLFFKIAIWRKDTAEALAYFAEFAKRSETESGFQLDAMKILSLCALLAEKKMKEELQTGLKSLPMCDLKFNPSTSIRKLIVNILRNTARMGSPELTRDVLDVLLDKRYCRIAHYFLEPLITSHLESGNVDAAVREFQHNLSKHNRVTGLKPLLAAVIEQDRDDLVATIARDASTVLDANAVNERIVVSYASRKDPELLIHKAERYNIELDEERLKSIGNDFAGAKTFAFALRRLNRPYDPFVDRAINILVRNKDYIGLKAFSAELANEGVAVSEEHSQRMDLAVRMSDLIRESEAPLDVMEELADVKEPTTPDGN